LFLIQEHCTLSFKNMKLVGAEILVKFMRQHAATKAWLSTWSHEVQAVSWSCPQDVKDRYASASFVGDDRIIFNVKGNSYRLEVRVNFALGIVRVIRCATHAEYDRWS
jgi:mRNA interferase HigB